MILECPQCNAKFVVPERAIGTAGREVRCAKCSHSWHAKPPKKQAASKQSATKPKKQEPIIPAASMYQKVISAAVVATAAVMTLIYFMPQTVGYASTKGIAFKDVTVIELPGGDDPAIEISGKIINTSSQAMHVPTLYVTLTDEEGDALQFWEFSSDDSMLEPDKTLPFSTGDLEVRFSNANRFVVDLGNSLELVLRKPYTVDTHKKDDHKSQSHHGSHH